MITITQENPHSTTTVIYPSSSGCSTEWTSDYVDNYLAVQDDDYYVSISTDSVVRDLYSVPTIPSPGEIEYVNLRTEVKSVDYSLHVDSYVKAQLSNSAGTDYINYDLSVSESYNERVSLINPDNREINPITGDLWDWDDFDDLQIGITASSVTKDVVSKEILMPNSTVTARLSPELFEGDWDAPFGMDCSYETINDYPLDTNEYMFKNSNLGWVESEEMEYESDFGRISNLVISDNDILHNFNDGFVNGFAYDFDNDDFTPMCIYEHEETYDFTGAGFTVLSSGATDYIIYPSSDLAGRKIQLLSMDSSSVSDYYVYEDSIDIEGGSDWVFAVTAHNDGTYAYFAGYTSDTSRGCVWSIGLSSGELSLVDKKDYPSQKSTTYSQYNTGVSTTTSNFIICTYSESASGINPNRYTSIVSYERDGSGNLTQKDAKSYHTGWIRGRGRNASLDIGDEIITISQSKSGFEIFSINNSTGVITHKNTHTIGTGENGMSGNQASNPQIFKHDGKFYFGFSNGHSYMYEIDTDNYELELVGKRTRCSSEPYFEAGLNYSFTPVIKNNSLYVFTAGEYIHALRYDNYYNTYGFDNPPTLGSIENIQVKFVQNNKCMDECEYKIHVISNGSEETQSVYSNQNTDQLLSTTFTTDPNTSSSWTQSSVSNIQVGVEIIPGSEQFCTCNERHEIYQLYVQVNHTLTDVSPEIRVRQQYLEIGYSPTASTVTLNTPTKTVAGNTRNINSINFWNGSREVYDLNRNGKSLSIEGMEWNKGGDKMESLRHMGLNGGDITISGFSFSPFNGDYKINSLDWNQISNNPNVWKWKLNLEEVEIEENCGE